MLGGAVDPDDDAWLRVIVRDSARPGLSDDVRRELGDRVVDVRVENTAARHRADQPELELSTRSPQELFDTFLGTRGETDERLPALFAELLDDELSNAG